MTSIKTFFQSNKNRYVICVLFISVIMFLSFAYRDIAETTRNGITFWKTCSEGDISGFYLMNENIQISNFFGYSEGAVYDFPLYFVFAIWNLPLWIYENMTGNFALDTVLGVIWAKSINIPFMVGVFIYMVKIGKHICGNRFDAKKAFLLMMSSVYVMTPILIMGQYDSIGLLFLLMAVYAYMQENRKKYILLFGIAILFKLFALFVYIPLILLKEKKVKHVLIDLLCGLSIIIVAKVFDALIFIRSDADYTFSKNYFVDFILQGKADFAYGSVSFFFVLYVLLCFYCHFHKTISGDKRNEWTLFISFVALSIFFITSLTHPQWCILLMPFGTLMIVCADENKQKILAIVDTVTMLGLLIAQIVFYSWVFNVACGAPALSGTFFKVNGDYLSVSVRDVIQSFCGQFDVNNLTLIGGGIFVSGLLYMIYVSRPNSRNEFVECDIEVESIIVVRLLIMAIMMGMLLGVMYLGAL